MTGTRLGASAVLALLLFIAGCAVGPRQPSDPLSAEEHNDLGAAYYVRGRYAWAAREFERAAARRPGWARALSNLGDARLALGERGAAIEAYEAARRAAPSDPLVANNLAWALLQDPARWREAEPVIGQALALRPTPRGYYLDTLGVLLFRKGETREALATFRAALADVGLRDPATRALVLRHAAEALAHLGERAAAERCERTARAVASAEAAPRVDEVGEGELLC